MPRTDYVVAVVLTPDLKNVVTLMKGRGPDGIANKVNFPGGHIEQGESALEAATRELREETGLDVPETAWLHVSNFSNPDYSLTVVTGICYNALEARTTTDEHISTVTVKQVVSQCLDEPEMFCPDFLSRLALALERHLY